MRNTDSPCGLSLTLLHNNKLRNGIGRKLSLRHSTLGPNRESGKLEGRISALHRSRSADRRHEGYALLRARRAARPPKSPEREGRTPAWDRVILRATERELAGTLEMQQKFCGPRVLYPGGDQLPPALQRQIYRRTSAKHTISANHGRTENATRKQFLMGERRFRLVLRGIVAEDAGSTSISTSPPSTT